jgi:hypothetical protein
MDITFTVTNQQAARIATAVGHRFAMRDANGALRDATTQEVKDYIIRHLKQTVIEQERQDAFANVTVSDF